uniref:CN hydrolase domain-containing protein n=1 Tax=Angiostrongylus cantonensis TaxID=6313 RepID=A0A0K0CTA9_ANGCA
MMLDETLERAEPTRQLLHPAENRFHVCLNGASDHCATNALMHGYILVDTEGLFQVGATETEGSSPWILLRLRDAIFAFRSDLTPYPPSGTINAPSNAPLRDCPA